MTDYYKLNKEEVVEKLNIDEKKGFSYSDVETLEKKYGKNKIDIKSDISFLKLFFVQATNFLNLLLLFLVFFSYMVWVYSRQFEHMVESIIIFVIFLVNSVIGAYENYSSKKIAAKLSKFLENKAIVLRNGEEAEINAKNLVPGDIVFLKSGDKIPADCYLIESEDLKVDESILTGESTSVFKNCTKILKNVPLAERVNMLYMNTYVVSGNAKAVVVETGKNTQMGKIAKALDDNSKKTSFLNEIDTAGKKISEVAMVLIFFVIIVLYFKGFDFIGIFLIASALIIGSIPEGLPAIVVFLLSRSVHKLSKKKILVKEMGLLETLGSVDVLCTDKTGTLTENRMVLKKLFIDGKLAHISECSSKARDMLVKICSLVNDAKILKNNIKGEPEDTALISYLKSNLTDYNFKYVRDKNPLIFFEPFSSENKFSYCKLKDQDLTLKKGAPEILLKNCSKVLIDGHEKDVTHEYIDKITTYMEEFSSTSLRLIGFSYSNENHEVFLGFCGLYDKPKDGISQTIKTLYNANVDVKMITGDNILTALAIAKEVGFRDPKGISWDEINSLSDDEFKEAVLNHNVFARISPQFKDKIVKTLQENGHSVAITGDGVNDSIALKHANVGVVMGSGSDIAKESGDLILLNNDFTVLPESIKEGRGIFFNIRKVVNYLLTANLAEVLTIFIASFFGIIPFTAIQILWVNFVTDVAPAMTLGVDKFSKELMNLKPNGKNEQIMNLRIILLTVFISIKKVALIFLIFLVAYHYSGSNLLFAQTIAFTWLAFTHIVRIAAIRFDEKAKLFKNKYLNYSLIAVVITQIIIIYTPLNVFFGVVPISFGGWIMLILFLGIALVLAKFITMFVDYIVEKSGVEKS